NKISTLSLHDALPISDHLPARPNQIANFVGWYLHGVEARRVIRNLLATAGNHFLHLFQDVHSPALRLRQSLTHDLRRNPAHLDIDRKSTRLNSSHSQI